MSKQKDNEMSKIKLLKRKLINFVRLLENE